MNRPAAVALFVAAGFITAGNAMAQNHEVKATVPFNFTVGGEAMPAGTYTLASESNPRLLSIASREKHIRHTTTVMTDDYGRIGNKLVFHRYGDQYFLRQIRTDGGAMNVDLPLSKQEKWAKAQRLEAANRINTDVMIALN